MSRPDPVAAFEARVARELDSPESLNGSGPDSWEPIDLGTLPDHPPIPPELGQTNLVYPGKRHVFSGPPESAKTLAAYCIMIQVVRLGGTAVLIDFEMGGFDARQRLRELGATAPEISKIAYLEPDESANEQRIQRLISLEPQLVVIDAAAGVYSMEGLDDNKRTDVEKISKLYIRAFWRCGIATILIDHVVKDVETRGRYAIGSERKLGGADVHLGFDPKKSISRGGQGKYSITTHKDRGGYLKRGHIADLHLSSSPETHMIDWAFTEAVVVTDEHGDIRPTIKMEQISNKLSGRTERLTTNEVKDLIGGNRELAGKAIKIMISEEYLDAEDGPRGSKNLLLIRPYNASDDSESGAPVPPVPVWFSSGSGIGATVTGSLVPGVHTPEPVQNRGHNPSEQVEIDDQFPGWFDNDGNLTDVASTEYINSLADESDDDIPLD